MNVFILLILGIPLIEIYLMIKVGSVIGAFNTIFLIFFTAITGIYFAKLEGLNAIPIYEIISGATLAFAALLLIIPGFLTDFFGFLLIIPITRKFFIRFISSNLRNKKNNNDIIEGSIEKHKQEDEK